MATNSSIYSMKPGFQLQGPQGQPVDRPCPESSFRPVEILYPLARSSSLPAELCLQKKSLLRLTGDHSGEKLFVDEGIVWITQSGNPDDFFLQAGETFEIAHKGAVLVEGVLDSRLKISPGSGPLGIGRTLGEAVMGVFSGQPESSAKDC